MSLDFRQVLDGLAKAIVIPGSAIQKYGLTDNWLTPQNLQLPMDVQGVLLNDGTSFRLGAKVQLQEPNGRLIAPVVHSLCLTTKLMLTERQIIALGYLSRKNVPDYNEAFVCFVQLFL